MTLDTADMRTLDDLGLVRRDEGVMFGDTLCFECLRQAVPYDLGEPGCRTCAANEELFASYTGRTPFRRADRPSLPRPLANLAAVELLLAAREVATFPATVGVRRVAKTQSSRFGTLVEVG